MSDLDDSNDLPRESPAIRPMAQLSPLTDSPTGPAPAVQPRLGIIHIMVWTTCVCLILAEYRALVDFGDLPPSRRSFLVVAHVIHSIVYGASLGGLGILAWRRYRGGSPFPIEPGHWCLILDGVSTILGLAGLAVSQWVYPWGDESYAYQMAGYRFRELVRLPKQAASLLLYLLGARNCTRRHWKRFFAVGALFAAFGAVATGIAAIASAPFPSYHVLHFARATRGVVLVSLIIVAVVSDRRASERRDWLHWCGVAVGVVGGLLISDVVGLDHAPFSNIVWIDKHQNQQHRPAVRQPQRRRPVAESGRRRTDGLGR